MSTVIFKSTYDVSKETYDVSKETYDVSVSVVYAINIQINISVVYTMYTQNMFCTHV